MKFLLGFEFFDISIDFFLKLIVLHHFDVVLRKSGVGECIDESGKTLPRSFPAGYFKWYFCLLSVDVVVGLRLKNSRKARFVLHDKVVIGVVFEYYIVKWTLLLHPRY